MSQFSDLSFLADDFLVMPAFLRCRFAFLAHNIPRFNVSVSSAEPKCRFVSRLGLWVYSHLWSGFGGTNREAFPSLKPLCHQRG